MLAEGGLLGDDEFLELTSKLAAVSRQPSVEAAKAVVLRASNSAFAGGPFFLPQPSVLQL